MKITEEQFENRFKPILDPLDGSWKVFGFDEVHDIEPEYIWTVCEEDDIGFLQNGYNRVNRLYYIVCDMPCHNHRSTIQVKLWDINELQSELED
mgnify:CR=1 FL=1